jgi:mannose-6-phosphate isomerase-like protein (cupin superfamily)
MRLIVTGHDASGSSVFTFAGLPPHRIVPGGGVEFLELWGTAGSLVVPDGADPLQAPTGAFFPAPGQTRFRLLRLPPGEFEPGEGGSDEMSGILERDDPAMHTTDTVDYVVILSGQVALELDHGRTEHLGPGDCVVQRGTRHAWRVRGTEPLVCAAVMIGAERQGATP